MADRMRSALLRASGGVIAAMALAGCGGSSGGPSTTAAVAPEAVLRSAIAALRTLHSYQGRFSGRSTEGPLSVNWEVGGPGELEIDATLPAGTLAMISVGPYTYVKASRSIWSTYPNLPATALNLVSNRWLQLPTGASGTIEQDTRTLTNPIKLAQCWAANGTSLRYVGRAVINGAPTVELRNSGKAPGTAPGFVYVASRSPKLPVKTVITGPTKPGGPTVCSHSTLITSGVETLGRFDRPLAIKTPAHPLLLGGGAVV